MSGGGAWLARLWNGILCRTYGAIEVWNISDMTAVFCRRRECRFFSITLLVHNGALLRFQYALKLQLCLLMELWGCGKTKFFTLQEVLTCSDIISVGLMFWYLK